MWQVAVIILIVMFVLIVLVMSALVIGSCRQQLVQLDKRVSAIEKRLEGIPEDEASRWPDATAPHETTFSIPHEDTAARRSDGTS